MYPAGEKNAPVDYTGDRSIESLVDFIKDKGTHGIAASVMDPVQVQEQGQAAPAATPATEGAKEKVAKAAEKVAEAIIGDAGHDEL